MFRSNATKLRFRPENGMQILAKGSISVFEKSGAYQLYITEMKQDGAGDLYLALEQLKKQLEAAGIFAQAHKKPIPRFPKRIGVITSPTGAAVRDILQILGRRYPLAEVDVFPAIVQGEQAPASLISGLNYFERAQNVDVIIIGRGGGSIEDLWGFNDPNLALTIYNCSIPIISAVGHETDFTICDFAADLRAPTPSGAAELAVPNQDDLYSSFIQDRKRMMAALLQQLENRKAILKRYAEAKVLSDPKAFTDQRFLHLDHLNERLCLSIENRCKEQKNKVFTAISKLDALSPLKVLKRGYAFVENGEANVIQSVDQLSINEQVCLRLSDGRAECHIKNIQKEV